MNKQRIPILSACMIALSAGAVMAQMTLINNFSLNSGSGEIIAYDKASQSLLATRSNGTIFQGIDIWNFSNPTNIVPATVSSVSFASLFQNDINNIGSVTSVAADPLSRGFAVAALFPKVWDNGGFLNADYSTPGKAVFFNINTGAILAALDVGFHTDSITFSPDGTKVVVANEAEYVDKATAVGNQRNGSISVIDISGVDAGNFMTVLPSLTQSAVTTKDLTGVSTSGHRFNLMNGIGGTETSLQAWEPEYISISGNKAYVSLQENNAVGVYDLTGHTWEKVISLGTRDLNNNDVINGGGVVLEDTPFKGLPMPDTVNAVVIGNKTYIVTANEGDFRVDDADRGDGSTLFDGNPANGEVDATVAAGIPAKYKTSNTRLLNNTGDTDNDGDIDEPTMAGSRSFSIIDADTGAVVYDSGGLLEAYVAANDPTAFADNRSRDKGPEPEGLVTAVIDGKTYLFISTERHNGIFQFDISDPANPVLVDYKRITTGTVPTAPEGMAFIPAADSPIGQNILLVGFEGNDRLGVFTVVPEPAHYALFAAATLLFVVGWRRSSKV